MPALLLIILPLFEIAGFIIVGNWIGVLPTIGLIILTTLLGALMLRVQGLGILGRIRAESEAGRVPGRELANGLMVAVAAFLLFLPGFITDTIGLLLFIPPVRDAVWRFFGRRITTVGGNFGARRPFGGGTAGGPRTIDLDPQDFHTDTKPGAEGAANAPSPWRKVGDR